jgi:hypothetical protein
MDEIKPGPMDEIKVVGAGAFGSPEIHVPRAKN